LNGHSLRMGNPVLFLRIRHFIKFMMVWFIIFIVWSLLIGENKRDDLLGYDTCLIGGYLLHKHFSSWLSVILSALSGFVHMLLRAHLTWYILAVFFFNPFQVGLLDLISLQHCLLLIFHVECTRWCRFTFLANFNNKSQGVLSRTNISRMILSTSVMNPYTWLMVWQWSLSASLQHNCSHRSCMPNCIKPKIIAWIWKVV
jgi:hypothetical protein